MRPTDIFDKILDGTLRSYQQIDREFAETLELMANWAQRREDAYQAYAERTGHRPMSEEQEKEAWLNYVLQQHDVEGS